MNNIFIYIFSSFPPFKKKFYHCFYHLPSYPLETQQISNIHANDNNMIFSKADYAEGYYN